MGRCAGELKQEEALDSFSADERRTALEELWGKVEAGEIVFAPVGSELNVHCHTFFSFNAYGYSPTRIAWKGKKEGLALAGIVDFDVLDGLEEFTAAGRLLNFKTTVGLETRVYVPEFADWEITSPGEPGITYHMGVGFPTVNLDGQAKAFLENLKQTAQDRNRKLMKRVNAFLSPVELDYSKDIIPLTPAGNATERHLCTAYARKARQVFSDDEALAQFWSEKLGSPVQQNDLPDGVPLLNWIRAKTMKRGGVGYVQPDGGSFPGMVQCNEFILEAGGIPCLTWLDGTSEGEKHIEELLDIAESTGVEAINIIPDRNYGPQVGREKYENLCGIVSIAKQRDLIPVIGTEMNSFGQKFVDDFASEELQPMLEYALRGANIIYAHAALQRQCGLGYTSEWARSHFPRRRDRNTYFEQVGKTMQPKDEERLKPFDKDTLPDDLLNEVAST